MEKKLKQADKGQVSTVGDLRRLLDGHTDDQPLVVCSHERMGGYVYRLADKLGDVLEASDGGSDGTLVLFVDADAGVAYDSEDDTVDLG